MKNNFKQRAANTNARDFVEMIDKLIAMRIVDSGGERVELLKRDMTDYLLATDPRGGIAVE